MGFTAFLIDDDPGVLKALSRIVRTAGYETVSYSSAQEFLREHDPSTPGCAILDLTMPELDGLELQQHLAQAGAERPIIFLSGQADIPASVQAMKAGAVDFLVKPVDREKLLSAIEQAKNRDDKARQARSERQGIEAKLATLTQREREVLEHVVEKTVKVHRGRVMAKLEVRSVAELVRLTERMYAEHARSGNS